MKPTRQQLELENYQLRHIVADLQWMARRYADGRRTYATAILNDHTRALLQMGVVLNPGGDKIIWARDYWGRAYDRLTDAEATPGTPEAKGEKDAG